jgi:hypothetical protein
MLGQPRPFQLWKLPSVGTRDFLDGSTLSRHINS